MDSHKAKGGNRRLEVIDTLLAISRIAIRAITNKRINPLLQPIDLPLNSFEPFALIDLPHVFEDANRMWLNARKML